MRKARIAVLGAGSHSRREHGPALRRLAAERPEVVELSGVCDLDEAKAAAYAASFGFRRVWRDLDRMLAEDRPDGLIAVTPVSLTAEIALRLLPLRIPLLIEKPPAETAAAARRLAEAASASATPHMVSLNRRFNPAVLMARQWLAANAASRPPFLALARMVRHRRAEPGFATGTAIHLVDLVCSFLGRPVRVEARRSPGSAEGSFAFQALADFAGVAVGLFAVSPEAGGVEETCELHGPDYLVRLDVAECGLEVWDRKALVLRWQTPEHEEGCFRTGTYHETEAFVRAVAGDGGFEPTIQAVLPSMSLAEAIQDGRTVDLGG
jgi:predicted dehydrogenase